MKTYRITDDLKITPVGHDLRIEMDDNVTGCLNAYTVSDMLVELIGLVFRPTSTFIRKDIARTPLGLGYLEISFRHPAEDRCEVEFRAYTHEDKVYNVVTIDDMGTITKMTDIVARILPSLCEEGL